MGERKGQNKYYPPDFDWKKHQSLNNYHGTHALRERARKLDKGILIIRFEMPYNIWCDGCGNHIGMGVRYNAEKTKVGMYYTTPIWKFHMKCHLCTNYFDIQTDPANCDYVILSGARRKEQRWDPAENEQIVTDDKNDQKKLATDAMFKLEHGTDDKAKSVKSTSVISQLQEASVDRYKDDYMANKLLRKTFREKKKLIRDAQASDRALLTKSSLGIKLLPESSDDIRQAGLLKYGTSISFEERQKQTRKQIEERPYFSSSFASTKSKDTSDIADKVRQLQYSKKAQHALKGLKNLSKADLGISDTAVYSSEKEICTQNQEQVKRCASSSDTEAIDSEQTKTCHSNNGLNNSLVSASYGDSDSSSTTDS